MEELSMVQETALEGLSLILLLPSHGMKHILSKLYKQVFDISVCHH